MSAFHQDEVNSGARRDKMRVALAVIDSELSRLDGLHSDVGARIRKAWREVLDFVAIADAPQLRTCPRCHHSGRLEATRCGFCWATLTPMLRTQPPKTYLREFAGPAPSAVDATELQPSLYCEHLNWWDVRQTPQVRP